MVSWSICFWIIEEFLPSFKELSDIRRMYIIRSFLLDKKSGRGYNKNLPVEDSNSSSLKISIWFCMMLREGINSE